MLGLLARGQVRSLYIWRRICFLFTFFFEKNNIDEKSILYWEGRWSQMTEILKIEPLLFNFDPTPLSDPALRSFSVVSSCSNKSHKAPNLKLHSISPTRSRCQTKQVCWRYLQVRASRGAEGEHWIRALYRNVAICVRGLPSFETLPCVTQTL